MVFYCLLFGFSDTSSAWTSEAMEGAMRLGIVHDLHTMYCCFTVSLPVLENSIIADILHSHRYRITSTAANIQRYLNSSIADILNAHPSYNRILLLYPYSKCAFLSNNNIQKE
jgi:hypothetical protein